MLKNDENLRESRLYFSLSGDEPYKTPCKDFTLPHFLERFIKKIILSQDEVCDFFNIFLLICGRRRYVEIFGYERLKFKNKFY